MVFRIGALYINTVVEFVDISTKTNYKTTYMRSFVVVDSFIVNNVRKATDGPYLSDSV